MRRGGQHHIPGDLAAPVVGGVTGDAIGGRWGHRRSTAPHAAKLMAAIHHQRRSTMLTLLWPWHSLEVANVEASECVMIVILGLIVLVAAVVVAVVGVLGNGAAHGFAVFGYHVTGSTGTLFLCGVVVGAVGLFGHRSAPWQAPAPRLDPATQPETLNGQAAPDVPAGASAPAG
jgi:hypothetical protein